MDAHCNWAFNIPVNCFNAKKFARYTCMVVVSKLVVGDTQCMFLAKAAFKVGIFGIQSYFKVSCYQYLIFMGRFSALVYRGRDVGTLMEDLRDLLNDPARLHLYDSIK